jgi:hypothetical protein
MTHLWVKWLHVPRSAFPGVTALFALVLTRGYFR